MDSFIQDFKYALRALRKSPGFTAAAVISLALGIGANTTIFTLVNALLLRPQPAAHPERLATVFTSESDGRPYGASSYPDYLDFRDHCTAFSGLAANQVGVISLTVDGRAQRVLGVLTSGNYFDVLGVRPALGRPIQRADDVPGAAPVALLSHNAWTRRYGADPDIVGRVIVLNGHPFTVAGVMGPEFRGNLMGLTPELWAPLATVGQAMPGMDDLMARGNRSLFLIGRLASGVSVPQAQAALAAQMKQMSSRNEGDRNRRVNVMSERDSRVFPAIRGPVNAFMGLLMTVVALVLLVACANVAGLQVARGTQRRKEIGIRLTLGAPRRRLLRQLLTESLVLSAAGGLGGLLLALWGTDLLMAFRPPLPMDVNLDLHPDGRVLAFTLVVSLAAGVLSGLVPARDASRPDVLAALKEGATGGGRGRLRGLLVSAQIALSVLLLAAAGLVVRGLLQARVLSPGFEPERVAVMSFDLKLYGYKEAAGRAFYSRLLESMSGLPGVESASLDRVVPLGVSGMRRGIFAEGHTRRPGEDVEVGSDQVGPGYFRTIGIRIARGREFAPGDAPGTPAVAVVNETFARTYWPGQDPIGKRITYDVSGQGHEWITVVGVARDSKYYTLGETPRPFCYTAYQQEYDAEMTLLVRTRGNPSAALPALREAVRRLDPNVPVFGMRPLSDQLGTSLVPSRLAAWLLGLFGALALLLASTGLYGVVAYSVSRRTNEFGVRMALGAAQRDIIRLVLRESLRMVVIGGGVGLVLALAASRLLTSVLNGVSPLDPATYAAVLLLLTAATMTASYVPARRAARVDPMVALRHE